MGLESRTYQKDNSKRVDSKMTDMFVGFIDEKTGEEYDKAKLEDPQLFKFLERATDDLKKNPFSGIKIPQDLWPKEYSKKYKIDNLYVSRIERTLRTLVRG